MADEVKEPVVETEEQDEFEKELERVQQKTENQFAAERRIANKPKVEDDTSEDLADKVAAKILPKLQAQTEATILEAKLEKLTTNSSEQKLIRHYLENTINVNAGTLDERLEMARALARKNSILKQASEINIASQNKKQIQNNSQGSGSATQTEGKDKDFSAQQLSDLERRAKRLGLNPKDYIERMRTNMQKAGGR